MAGSSISSLESVTVSPVFQSILPMATMSPQQASVTSVLFLPHMVYRRPSLSVEEARTLRRDMPAVILPERTLTKLYLPNLSDTVLNTKPSTPSFFASGAGQ